MWRTCLAVAALVAAAPIPPAAASPAAERCLEVSRGKSIGAALPRVKARVARGGPLTIVAIGSSSTRGVGASDWASTYPEVMQRELMRLKPGLTVNIINAGSNGETVYGQLARMERDATARSPDLVIWQLGSNDVIWPWGGMPDDMEGRVVEAIRQVRAAGADMILMDLQNSPVVARARLRQPMLEMTARAARSGGAGLFRRYALLERAVQAGVPLGELASWDGIHNTDAAYDCMGRALARAIHAAVR